MQHILVVDDDPAIRDVVADILEISDYTVETAENGAEALEKIRHDRPRAVLLDLMMPIMNGWEFLRACRREAPCAHVPIVVMSAARDARDAAHEFGARGFLPKPFDIDTVLSMVEQVARASPRR